MAEPSLRDLPDALLALVFNLLDMASWLTGAKLVCRSWRDVSVPLVGLELPVRAPGLESVCRHLARSALRSLALRRSSDLLEDDLYSLANSLLPNLTALDIVCEAFKVNEQVMDTLSRGLAPLARLSRITRLSLDIQEDSLFPLDSEFPEDVVARLPCLPLIEEGQIWGVHVDGASLSSWLSLRELDLEHASMTTADLAIMATSLTQLEVLTLPFFTGPKHHWRGSKLCTLRQLAAASQGRLDEEDHEIFGDMVQAAAACLQVVKLGPNRLSGTVLVSLEACPRLVTLVRQFEQGSRFADAFCSPRAASFQALQQLALPCSDLSLQQFVWTFGAARLRELNVDSSTHLSLVDLRPWMKFLRD
jgi:hypothetical protein